MKLTEYVNNTPIWERMSHCDPTSPCQLGAHHSGLKPTILQFLSLVDDTTPDNRELFHTIHICKHDKSNGCCTNPLHIFPGTNQENALLRYQEQDLPWADSSKASFKNPATGEFVYMDRAEAKSRGFVGVTAGTAPYKDPQTGESRHMTREEAEELGWVGVASGRRQFRNPVTGELRLLPCEQGEQLGWERTTPESTTPWKGLSEEEVSQQRSIAAKRLMSELWLSSITGHVSRKAGVTTVHRRLGIDDKPVKVPEAIKGIVVKGGKADKAFNLEVYECWLSLCGGES